MEREVEVKYKLKNNQTSACSSSGLDEMATEWDGKGEVKVVKEGVLVVGELKFAIGLQCICNKKTYLIDSNNWTMNAHDLWFD